MNGRRPRALALAVWAALGPAMGVCDEPPPSVDEVVVTARRREELYRDVPVSLTVLPPELLRDTGVSRLDEIQPLVPNLTFVTSPNGTEVNVLLRGVGQLEEGEPGVGIYVDGVYLPRGSNALLNVIDIARIEVLRGPQGTLFGKNTVGGAIAVTTVRPQPEPGASMRLRFAEFGTIESQATLDVPIALGPFDGKLFSRFSFASADRTGYTRNVAPAFDQSYNDRRARWALGSLYYVPLDELEISVNGNWFEDESHGWGGRCVFVQRPPDAAVAALLDGAFPDFERKCRASRNPFRFRSDVDAVSNPTDYGVWGNATWTRRAMGLLDELQLRAIASWREQSIRFLEDPDMTTDRVVVLSALGGSDPLDGEPREGRQVSIEGQVHAVALDGTLDAVAGVYAQWEDRRQGTTTRALEGTVADQFGGTILSTIEQDDRDWALFGQATWAPLEWLQLTGGLRYTRETKRVDRLTVNPFLQGAARVILDAGAEDTFDAVTPMATVALHATDPMLAALRLDHAMTYFTYSRGFKGGGFNQIAFSTRDASQPLGAFDPEFLDSYDLGFRVGGFDGRAHMSTAFFLGHYNDIQVDQRLTIPGANPDDLPVIEIATLNAAEATIRGVEIETSFEPLERLVVTEALGLLDARYDEFVGPDELDNQKVIDRAGETFNNVPELTHHLALHYRWPLPDRVPAALRGALRPRLDWFYRSRVHFLAPEVHQAEQPGFHRIDLRLGYEFRDERAEAALWVRNVTDEAYVGRVTSLVPFFGTLSRFYQPPRTVGGEVTVRF